MLAKIVKWTYRPFLAYPEWTERLVYLLVFLFPIAGMSVRGWLTNIFNLLALLGLATLWRKRESLLQAEKIFLWIFVAYFSMFIIAALGNGWSAVQTHELGTESRFLLVIPVYFLVRRYPDCAAWLLRGAVIGGFCLFAQAYSDVMIHNMPTAWGVYSKNIIGPFAVLIAFWSMYYFWQNKSRIHWMMSLIILLSVVAAMIAAGLSGSRGSYVGFVITGFFCILFFSRPRWMLVSLIVMSLAGLSLYKEIEIVRHGVDVAIGETVDYFKAKDHVHDPSSDTSTGIRLEMMRTGILFVRDNPWIGIGPGNYQDKAEIYVKEGKANFSIAQHGYPHNAFLEVATDKGLLGLVTLLLLLYYPAYIYIKGYKVCKPTAVVGLIHIVALSAFGLTDHSVVVMNNYTSILLLGMAIFFSGHIRACKQHLVHG